MMLSIVEQLEQAARQREAGENYWRQRSEPDDKHAPHPSSKKGNTGAMVPWEQSRSKALLDALPPGKWILRSVLVNEILDDWPVTQIQACIDQLRKKGMLACRSRGDAFALYRIEAAA